MAGEAAAAGPESGADIDALGRQQALVDRLTRTLEASAGRVERFETHISWVLVAGGHAYKFKKALKLPFLDFSTLDARRFYCMEECRLNRRLAPALYIDVVPVADEAGGPAIGAAGPPIEYAVRMRVFEQGALWTSRLAHGQLEGGEVDQLAALLARFHRQARQAPADAAWGTPATVLATFGATFAALEAELRVELQAEPGPQAGRADLAAVREWEAQRRAAFVAEVAARRRDGMVRECHGDLHCGNVVTANGEVQVFDCIEFDEALRWIDVMDDLAFIQMDLGFRGRPELAARLLNRYLEESGDYPGLALLPAHRAHRALVRARVMLLRARQAGASAAEQVACRREGLAYLSYARACAARPSAAVIAMHGASGSGKTTLARTLVELLGAVQLRSDVERKRLQGAMDQTMRQPLYGAVMTRRTYARLAALARCVVAAGWPVVVDAACLMAEQRARFRHLAADMGVPFLIVDLGAAPGTLLGRIASRRQAGLDASDADAAVLGHQIRRAEPLSRQERAHALTVDTGAASGPAGLRAAGLAVCAALARGGPAGPQPGRASGAP